VTVSVAPAAGDVVLAVMDDGKANALSFEAVAALRAALAEAASTGRALVVAGREGTFCAGFDLGVINGGDRAAVAALVREGVGLFREIFEAPIPVVAAATGHALAAGALLLLAADHRVGVRAEAKIGLTEVRLGMALPGFALAMASHRLAPVHLTAATLFARVLGPGDAVHVGYLDDVSDDPISKAVEAASEFASLSPEAFRTTKQQLRRAVVTELNRLAP
jgi:enoyl-CoA hydratase